MKWFSFQAKADNTVEVSIFDEIGMWGVSAKEFISELKKHAGKKVSCLINSPGGSVFDALAIYNALRAHGGEVTVKVMGVAASAASLIAMAGDKIIMPENTFMMIHNPMVGAYGNADEMRDMADVLDKIAASLIGTYVARTGLSEKDVKDLLDAETWLNAADAVEKGFATEMEVALKIAASFDVERLPETIRKVYEAKAIDVEDAVITVTVEESETDAGGSTETTTTTVTTWSGDAANPESDPVDPPTDTLATEIQAAADTLGMGAYATVAAFHASVKTLDDAKTFLANAREVIALCALAKKPEMATELVTSGVLAAEARIKLSDVLAADDAAKHTSQVPPIQNNQSTASGAGVWAKIFPPPKQS
jgi:ATP-dependent protease ClpP protease subunit